MFYSEYAPNDFARILAKKREKLNVSTKKMGMLLGVSQHTIELWEKGKCMPKPKKQKNDLWKTHNDFINEIKAL